MRKRYFTKKVVNTIHKILAKNFYRINLVNSSHFVLQQLFKENFKVLENIFGVVKIHHIYIKHVTDQERYIF